MKYATKDKSGRIVYHDTSDRKKCLTYAEWQGILNEPTFKDHTYSSGSDYYCNSDGKRITYFWAKFNQYARFPFLVAEIHSRFGRGVEVKTFDIGYPNYELRIRAYHNWK